MDSRYFVFGHTDKGKGIIVEVAAETMGQALDVARETYDWCKFNHVTICATTILDDFADRMLVLTSEGGSWGEVRSLLWEYLQVELLNTTKFVMKKGEVIQHQQGKFVNLTSFINKR